MTAPLPDSPSAGVDVDVDIRRAGLGDGGMAPDAQPAGPADAQPASPGDGAPGRRVRHRRWDRIVRHWLAVVVVMVAVTVVGRRFAVDEYVVDGDSMRSALHDGDRIIVNRLAYLFDGPDRGDVVVIDAGAAGSVHPGGEALVKRVVGLPGEVVDVAGCTVSINGVRLTEPYLDVRVLAADGCGPAQPSLVVPAGHVFVLGDHRGDSTDSRMFGPVDEALLIGRAAAVIWPRTDWSSL